MGGKNAIGYYGYEWVAYINKTYILQNYSNCFIYVYEWMSVWVDNFDRSILHGIGDRRDEAVEFLLENSTLLGYR